MGEQRLESFLMISMQILMLLDYNIQKNFKEPNHIIGHLHLIRRNKVLTISYTIQTTIHVRYGTFLLQNCNSFTCTDNIKMSRKK